MNRIYQRGDIYYADLGKGIGSEQEGYRPVIIIQNNTGNKFSPTVIVASMTSRTATKAKLPTHVYIDETLELGQPSIVLLEQVRTIDKRRLKCYVGKLADTTVPALNRALAISVALNYRVLSL